MLPELTREEEIKNLIEKWDNPPAQKQQEPISPQYLIELESRYTEQEIARLSPLTDSAEQLAEILEEGLRSTELFTEKEEEELDKKAEIASYRYVHQLNILEQLVNINALSTCIELIQRVTEEDEQIELKHELIRYATQTQPRNFLSALEKQIPTLFSDPVEQLQAFIELLQEEPSEKDTGYIREEITLHTRHEQEDLPRYITLCISLWKKTEAQTDLDLADNILKKIPSEVELSHALHHLARNTGKTTYYVAAFRLARRFRNPKNQISTVNQLLGSIAFAYQKKSMPSMPTAMAELPALSTEQVETILQELRLINRRWANALKKRLNS